MTPKFSEGEVVILQSVSSPELNGEYTVIQCIYKQGDNYTCRLTGTPIVFPDVPSPLPAMYRLDGCIPEYTYVWEDGSGTFVGEGTWDESALRKKYEKGMDFNSLMGTLKTPVGELV